MSRREREGRHLPAAVARSLARGRVARGLSQRQAAVATGLSGRYLGYLEQGVRRPSTAVAWVLIGLYDLGADERAALLDVSVEAAGYSSPGRRLPSDVTDRRSTGRWTR